MRMCLFRQLHEKSNHTQHRIRIGKSTSSVSNSKSEESTNRNREKSVSNRLEMVGKRGNPVGRCGLAETEKQVESASE